MVMMAKHEDVDSESKTMRYKELIIDGLVPHLVLDGTFWLNCKVMVNRENLIKIIENYE